MTGSTEGKAINANILIFLSESEGRFSISQRQFLPFCCWSSVSGHFGRYVPNREVQVHCTSQACCLLQSLQPCGCLFSKRLFFPSSTFAWSHQRPYHLVPTATLHKQTNTPGLSSGGSVRNRNTFLTRIIGLSSLEICKRNVIWYNTL